MRRVVVTGLGLVAPCGNSVSQAWNAALEGRSAVRPISLFDASKLPVRIAAEVRDFDATTFMDPKEARRSSRFVQFAAGAAREAILDSGLDLNGNTERYGCILGVGIGAFAEVERSTLLMHERGPDRVSPFLIPYTIPNMAAGVISIAHNLRGPNLCTSSACASGSHAIGEALLHIRQGTADLMAAGGAESIIGPLAMASFAQMGTLSARNDCPEEASRPFDRDRDGFVMGEGAGILVLEELDHARRRGARIYAELVGYGMTADAYHITSLGPKAEGGRRAMAMALNAGRVSAAQVDYINAHGTSTQQNDACESRAIQDLFGRRANEIAISSTKGVTGHCLGAAGGIEAVFTVLAMHHSLVPPTCNYSNSDPECPLDYTPNQPRKRKIRFAISNSFGFGGQNACLAFQQLQ